MVNNLPAKQETRVHSLGQQGDLEKEMASHSKILAWRITWTEESGGLQAMKPQSLTQLSDETTTAAEKALVSLGAHPVRTYPAPSMVTYIDY